jgi:glycosyltransferase involved in cell wall biosynthesis
MLSICLATYNEEKNIKKCLEAIKDIADEIVVVDGSSTDNTREIARELGAKVIKTTNKPIFHINKQMAMDAVKGDLVLQLDADEWPDQELKNFIKKTHEAVMGSKQNQGAPRQSNQNNHPSSPVAWWLKRKNYFLGRYLKKGGQYPDPVIRLYINGYARLPQKDVHEQMQVDGEVGLADGHLIHYANPTFSDYLRKFITYTNLKSQQLREAGVEVNIPNSFKYLIGKPLKTFFLIFFRHKGFVDGIAGFVFATMSGLHHAVAYLMLWEAKVIKNSPNSRKKNL